MDELLGSIALFPYEYVPVRWAACDGRNMAINQNAALFSLLGARFGGDGMTRFQLPDLRDKAPAPGLTYCICVEGPYPMREGM